MRDLQFREMKKTLLREGIAPKHVVRIIKELRDHHADLEQEAQSSGMSSSEATGHAWENLGEENMVIQEALSRPELKSWSSRCPWAFYTLTPLCALIALTVIWVFSIVEWGLYSKLEKYGQYPPGKYLLQMLLHFL